MTAPAPRPLSREEMLAEVERLMAAERGHANYCRRMRRLWAWGAALNRLSYLEWHAAALRAQLAAMGGEP